MKNLIRNGGFERGTIDFWTAFDKKSFGVVATPVFKGSYAGKIVCDGANNPYLMTNDFVPLAIGEIAYFEAWIRANVMCSCYLRVEYYDEQLEVIETVTYESFNPGTSGYVQELQVISGIEGAVYCKPYLYLAHSTVDDYFLVDNVSMYKFTPEDMMCGVRLMDDRDSLTTSGTYNSPWSVVSGFREATFLLYVGTLTGTADTLDVTIESQSNFKSNEYVLVTFEQVTASDNEHVIVITEGLGTKIRVNAVLAGSNLDCDYWLEAVFKR